VTRFDLKAAIVKFDSSVTTEDLPPLDTLWTRAAVAAALEAGAGRSALHAPEDGRILFDDGGGNSWRLLCLEGGKGLLIGFDHECDEHIEDPALDVFADAPAWLPWEWALDLEARGPIGFAYWWDGTCWARTPYPEYVTSDGIGWMLPPLLTEDGFREWITGALERSTGHRGTSGAAAAAALGDALPGLLRTAAAGEWTRATLDTVLGALGEGVATDPGEAERVARELGLMAGTARPTTAQGTEKPVRPDFAFRGVGLLGDLMRRETEIPGRPEPAPGPELRALVDWARAHRLDASGRAVLVHDAVRAAWFVVPRERELTEEAALWRALHEAETDPVHGGWLYLRLEVTEDDHTVQRAYDHWPEWFTEHTSGPDLITAGYSFTLWLRERDRAWLPSWADDRRRRAAAAALPPDTAAPGGPAPSYPWKRFTPQETEAHLDRLLEVLAETVTGPWTSIRLTGNMLLEVSGLLLHAVRPDGTEERVTAPAKARTLLSALRSGTYERGTGAWYRVEIAFHRDGDREVAYDHEGEPAFGRRVGDAPYRVDFRYFPRAAEHVPDWLHRRISP
jgi:hypothetical protein